MMKSLRGWEFDELEGQSQSTEKRNSYLLQSTEKRNSYLLKNVVTAVEANVQF
jgi:hypothetical protein